MVRRVGLLAILLSLSITPLAQDAAHARHRMANDPVLDDFGMQAAGVSPGELRMRRQAELDMARQRLQQVHQDTDQLVALAHQLKAALDSAGSQALSVDAIKKTHQIEKLAKQIRNKMKGF